MTSSFASIEKPKLNYMRGKTDPDYEGLATGFHWRDIHEELDWLPGGRLNMAHEAIDRHANGDRRDKVALVWEGKDGERETYTFGRLKVLTNKFANVLKSLGIGRGDLVLTLMDRVPELYVAFLGILKAGAVAGPLYASSSPELVRDRMRETGAKVLVTHPELRRHISGVIPELFELQHIVIVNKNDRDPSHREIADLSYEEEMSKAPADFDVVATGQLDGSILSYTSGTTGKPKGVVYRHEAAVQQYATGKWVLDLQDDDVYWCTSDPAWATGTAYGIVAPWTNGVTQLIYEGGFGAGAWYEQIQKHRVTVWYTSAAAIRMLMKAGSSLPRRYDLSSLRHVCTVGAPLGPDAVAWAHEVLDAPLHDSWWQTETGAILVANCAGMKIRPGSMGRPVPGVEVGIVDGEFNPVLPGNDGNLVVRPGWPSMFQAYWNNTEMYSSRFRKGWYITGDRARVDEDGYLWFAGRGDEVFSVGDAQPNQGARP